MGSTCFGCADFRIPRGVGRPIDAAQKTDEALLLWLRGRAAADTLEPRARRFSPITCPVYVPLSFPDDPVPAKPSAVGWPDFYRHYHDGH